MDFVSTLYCLVLKIKLSFNFVSANANTNVMTKSISEKHAYVKQFSLYTPTASNSILFRHHSERRFLLGIFMLNENILF